MSKVYVVEHGYDYEGSTIQGIYSTVELAQGKAAKEVAKRTNKWVQYEQKSDTQWRSSSESIDISEYDLDDL